MKKKLQFSLTIILIVVSMFVSHCVSTKPAQLEEEKKTQSYYQNQDLDTLQDFWLATNQYKAREVILKEFERRKAYNTLRSCYDITGWMMRRESGQDRKNDKLFILGAFGRLKEQKAVPLLTELLEDKNSDLRMVALDALGNIKDQSSVESIFPLLFENDQNVRAQAIHTLGEIGDPRAIGRISLLLADKDPFIRELAEANLKRLGASDEQIKDWKRKAEDLTIDDVFEAKISYEKALIEKATLQAKLENEKDLKKQLEESLKNQETASGKQKNLIESLYEKERQLKSKQAQLDITRQQSAEYQTELQRLNARVQSLNAELNQAKTQAATENVKEELDKTLEAKTKLEQETKSSREKEAMLREEIVSLNALAEKTRLEAEDAKQEVSALRNREKQLATQVDELKERLDRSMAPVLVVSKPINGTKIESPNTLLHFIAVDDKGISKVDVYLNGHRMKMEHNRGLKIISTDDKFSKKIDIVEKLQLIKGQNIIKISVTDTDGISREELIHITRVKARGDIWAIVIGINQYQHTRNLKYAVNDAQAFKDYLKDYVGLPDERIFYLANQEATKSKIERLLGTTIKRKASRDDTVIIFYAGHGAVEPDPSNLDGDGFEKYLLPYDADLEDLYSTSISMNDIRTIFTRISAERLIFIADTCYSGASGGRTMMATKTRANLSDKFYDRISRGKGRVIISSCSANEISKEDDTLQHGIFSYHLLEGLKGRADQDGDGIITVSELFSYISRKVPEASAQDQHPVKKGETEGELVIGRIK